MADRRKLTDKFVRALTPTPGRQVEYFDTLPPALALRVGGPDRERAIKTWTLRYRNSEGRQRRIKLGEYPAVTIDQARTLALQTLSATAHGRDPASEKRRAKAEAAARRVKTLSDLADDYFAKAALGRHRPGLPHRGGQSTKLESGG